MKEFLDSVKQEVSDCDGRYYKKPTKTITHKYSELAAILIRFKLIGQPDYSNQFISFGYIDDQVEKYAKIDDMEAADLAERWDIKFLGRSFTDWRNAQTDKFVNMDFTKRPKSIRSNIVTITVNLRLKSAEQ